MDSPASAKRLPPWFRIRLAANNQSAFIRNIIGDKKLHTVCRSAACPNRTECWNSGTATFMILGNVCTRNCGFCNVPAGRPAGLDGSEPVRVAEAVCALNLAYAVITSVTRDDLPDGGAGIFAETVRAIRERSPECRIEVLIPDFRGSESSLRTVLDARPEVLNHNIETVPRLYPLARPQADYKRSLDLLRRAADFGTVKTGVMLGLGEGTEEVLAVLRDAREAGCSIITLGQYLRPNQAALPVLKYYDPAEFEELRRHALEMGFRRVVSGPLVRSSYHAGDYY